MFDTKISAEAMRQLDTRLDNLLTQGIKADSVQSGELNMNGCAKGHCQAWD